MQQSSRLLFSKCAISKYGRRYAAGACARGPCCISRRRRATGEALQRVCVPDSRVNHATADFFFRERRPSTDRCADACHRRTCPSPVAAPPPCNFQAHACAALLIIQSASFQHSKADVQHRPDTRQGCLRSAWRRKGVVIGWARVLFHSASTGVERQFRTALDGCLCLPDRPAGAGPRDRTWVVWCGVQGEATRRMGVRQGASRRVVVDAVRVRVRVAGAPSFVLRCVVCFVILWWRAVRGVRVIRLRAARLELRAVWRVRVF
jgi:hypothetical protein